MFNSSSGKSIKSETGPGSRMSDRLSALPEEVLCYLLSFLTLRDSARARLLSPRWRYILGHHSVLNFDALNVLGSEKSSCEPYDHDDQSKFVRVVDQFLETWNGRNLSTLKVGFFLGNKQASIIDKWVKSGIAMEIENLELSFLPISSNENYVLSDQLFQSGKANYLKCLRLKYCALTFSAEYSSWINHLARLELYCVPLHQKDIDCVLSGGLNLTSLILVHCGKQKFSSINVELPHLKKLVLYESFRGIELNCPNLESFVFVEVNGCLIEFLQFTFVPLLTSVVLVLSPLTIHPPSWSLVFDDLARHAPKLQELSLYGVNEVVPLPLNTTMLCLKRMDILSFDGFDVFTITYLLNASPFLEIFHLQVAAVQQASNYKQTPQREYIDCQHIHLKEVKIKRFTRTCNEVQFVRYLLKNAVNLDRMVIVEDCGCPSTKEDMGSRHHCLFKEETSYAANYCSLKREEMATTLLQDMKTNAELVFMTPMLGVVLKASNRVNCGVHLVCPGS